MMNDKTNIEENLSYTELVFGRINKKLGKQWSKEEIERWILARIKETDVCNFHKKGKNIYIRNEVHQVQLTINASTKRIITVDRLK